MLAGHRAERVVVEGGDKVLIADHEGREVRVAFDQVLVQSGASPTPRATDSRILAFDHAATHAATDAALQTLYPNITACGDVAGPFQFTHTAAHQAWTAAVNAMFGDLRRFEADYRVVPWAIFTDPEVARVGINERRRARRISRTRRRSTASTISIARLPKAPRADSSKS